MALLCWLILAQTPQATEGCLAELASSGCRLAPAHRPPQAPALSLQCPAAHPGPQARLRTHLETMDMEVSKVINRPLSLCLLMSY